MMKIGLDGYCKDCDWYPANEKRTLQEHHEVLSAHAKEAEGHTVALEFGPFVEYWRFEGGERVQLSAGLGDLLAFNVTTT